LELALEGFEGSIELLYELVRKSIVEVSRISLSYISMKILEYLNRPDVDLNRASHYLYLLSLLMRIKLSLLLPTEENFQEESSVEEGERDFSWLESARERLEKIYKERERFLHHFREGNFPQKIRVVADLEDFIEAYFSITKREIARKNLEERLGRIDFSELMDEISRKIETMEKFSLTELIRLVRNREEAIFIFFFLLELLRQGEIIAIQEQPFSQIFVWTREAFENEFKGIESPY